MADRLRPPRRHLKRVRTMRRRLSMDARYIAHLMEMDLVFGHRDRFRRRLRQALLRAFTEGVNQN